MPMQEVKKKPSVVGSLPGISRRPSLVEREGHTNGHAPRSGNGNGSGAQSQTLKSVSSRQSLKNRAFGLFMSVDSVDAPKDSASSIPPSSALFPFSPTDSDFGGSKTAVDYDTTVDTDRTITKKLVAEKREQARLAASKEPIPGTSLQPVPPVAPRSPTPNRSMYDGHEVDNADRPMKRHSVSSGSQRPYLFDASCRFHCSGTQTDVKHGSDRFHLIGRGREGGEAVGLQCRGCKGV